MENFLIEFDKSGVRHVIKGEGIETIGDLKNRIQQEFQIDADEQILLHQDNLMFNDEKIARLIDIENNKKMTLHIKKDVNTLVQVTIICQRGGGCMMSICCGQTVSVLKEKINKILGYGPFRQHLSYLGKSMKDDDVLRDYITHKTPTFSATIASEGEPKNYVFVERNNKQEHYHLEQEDTIYTLEHRFCKKHNLLENYCNFYFTWQGQQLAGPKTLKELSIPNNAVLGYSDYNAIIK